MNEMIVEKLIQKISNMLEEVNDLNVQVRGVRPSQEVLNACNARLDAIQGALKELGVVLKASNVQSTGMGGKVEGMAEELKVIQKKLDELPSQIGIRPAVIQELKTAMNRLFEQLREPLKKDVVHHHILKGPMVAIMGYLAAVIFLGLSVYFWTRVNDRKERDIKYRWLLAVPISEIGPYLYYIDSFYRADPEQFDKMTIQLEELQERDIRMKKVSAEAVEDLQVIRELADGSK